MSVLQTIFGVIRSLFPSGPEVKKKQELHRIEASLRAFVPCIYKGGLMQANFAETFSMLHKNSKLIDDILRDTICSGNLAQANHFTDTLLLTGLSEESQEALESLKYDNRKQAVAQSKLTLTRFFDEEHRKQEQIVRELNSDKLKEVDIIVAQLKQLHDVCSYNYINAIHIFDPDYTGLSTYVPSFPPMPPDPFADICSDLYYLTADFHITVTMQNAIEALAALRKGAKLGYGERLSIEGNLKKINTVFRRVLTQELLKDIVCVAQHNPEVTLQTASYSSDSRKKLSTMLEAAFMADENRLKMEIKDQTITSEINDLFGDKKLLVLGGYNTDTDAQLRHGSPATLLWITPLQIIKSFVTYYYDAKVQDLLNDIVLEGFFEDPDYKSSFSSLMFNCNESLARIKLFEASFDKEQKNDVKLLIGYIRDSSKDSEFLARLSLKVDEINANAKELIQKESENFLSMYKIIGKILSDAKSSASVNISNLKVLWTSSRNKENASKVEREYGYWKIFLEIMRNYADIGQIKEEL